MIENELVYSSDASMNRYVMLKNENTINFFVEDYGKEFEYETIFEKLFGNQYKIKSIFGVGGKRALIDTFYEFGPNDIDNKDIKNIYIADGDFDFLLFPETMISSPNFIYLKTYNIENYFIDEKSVVDYCRGYYKLQKSEVIKKLKYHDWKQQIISIGASVFLTHCYVQKYKLGIKNVDKGPGFFIDEKTGFERQNSFDLYIKEISEFTHLPIEEINENIECIRSKYIEINGENYEPLICGKFLMFSLANYILSLSSEKNLDFEKFRWFLISNINIDKLTYIKDAVESI